MGKQHRTPMMVGRAGRVKDASRARASIAPTIGILQTSFVLLVVMMTVRMATSQGLPCELANQQVQLANIQTGLSIVLQGQLKKAEPSS